MQNTKGLSIKYDMGTSQLIEAENPLAAAEIILPIGMQGTGSLF